MKKVYWEWYKYIKEDINDEAIRIEAEIEIMIRNWGIQQFKGLLHLIKKLELDK